MNFKEGDIVTIKKGAYKIAKKRNFDNPEMIICEGETGIILYVFDNVKLRENDFDTMYNVKFNSERTWSWTKECLQKYYSNIEIILDIENNL